MDGTTALILIGALLIILALAVYYKANGFISPSPHAFNPVPSLSSNNDDIPKSTVVPSLRPDLMLVKEIVKDICTRLNRDSSYDFPKELVNIGHRVKEVTEFLCLESPEVGIVGICGMGGSGKTTIAQALFHKLKPHFESHSFVANIRENLTKYGVEHVVNKCLSELLDDKDIGTYSYSIRSSIVKNRLGRLRILLVLDDVDNFIHVEDIIKMRDWCGIGSRIIVTSRDMHVLKNSGAYKIYNVPQMEFHDALQLFCLNAFKQNNPIEDYSMLSKRAVDYCGGIPLALKVLGSFLYGRRKEEWESALQKLEQTPHPEVFNVLKLSFDGLDEDQKKMFLDMACFSGLIMLDIYGFYDFTAKSDVAVLKERWLISSDPTTFIMHNLVKSMGQQICRWQINEPAKPIRLWNHTEIYRFLKNNKGFERIECLSWDIDRTKSIVLKADVFERMCNLRFLEISGPGSDVFREGINILPEELIILHWEKYPLKFVPLNFCAENLVILQMRNSSLVQLWDEDLKFPNLKKINLYGSRNLRKLPDLCQTPNIEEIEVSECTSLLQIYSSGPLHRLSKLLLKYCSSLQSVGVSKLNVAHGKLQQLWDGSPSFPFLQKMDLLSCKDLVSLPDLSETPNIQDINLSGCVKLVQVQSSSILANLRWLNLEDCENLRDVNVGGNKINEGTSSSVLVAVYNYFNLISLSFIKVSVNVFMCDDGGDIDLSGFHLKVEYSESAEIKSLAQSLSSLLPNSVSKLQWIELTKSSDHYYDSHFQTRFPYPDYSWSVDITELVLERTWRRVANVVKWEETVTKQVGMKLESLEEEEEEEEEYYYKKEKERDRCTGESYTVYNRYKIVRFPKGMNHWSSLDTRIVNHPSLLALKKLGLQPIKDLLAKKKKPIKDLTFSVNKGGTYYSINHSQKELCSLHSTTIRCNLSFTPGILRLKLY